MKKITILVPAYNEEEALPLLYERVSKIMNDMKNYEFELLFVNDGSKDNTFLEIKNIIEKYDSLNIVGINFSRNFGKEAAMLAGLKKSTGEYTALIDADLQQHPKYVKQMLEYIEEHNEYDCITCYQEKRKENKFIIWLKEKFYSLINKISDIPFYKNASDFRLFNRKVLSSVLDMTEYYRFSKGIKDLFSATFLYAGRIIFPALTSSSSLCAHQPEILEVANIGVNISSGIPSIVYTNPL